MFRTASAGKVETNAAGMITKYFARSFAMEKVVSAPPGHQELLPDLHDLDQFCGITLEIDHVGRLAGRLGPGIHRHGDIRLGESGGIVGAVAVIATIRPPAWYCPDQFEFALRSRLRRKSSTPASAARNTVSHSGNLTMPVINERENVTISPQSMR